MVFKVKFRDHFLCSAVQTHLTKAAGTWFLSGSDRALAGAGRVEAGPTVSPGQVQSWAR